MALEELLAASLSPDQPTRTNAERALSSEISATQLVQYINGSTNSAFRLSALVYLKNHVLHHWSAQFAEFRGQICSEEEKHILRHECFRLVGDGERAVRLQAGFITSKIIAADYPDEWATVLDDLLAVLAKPPSEDWLHGALVVMKDFVDDSMSEEQFLPIAQMLVQYLLLITRNVSYRGEIRAQAVDVFISCLDSLEMLSSTRREGIRVFVDNALPPWMETIVQIVNTPNTNFDLKNRSLETILKLRLLFPSQLVHFLPVIFLPIYKSLHAIDIHTEENTQATSLQVEFLRKAVQAKVIVEETLHRRDVFEGCVALSLKFAQISTSLHDDWLADMDGFVEDLEETSFSLRRLCTDLLEDLQKINPVWTREILEQAVKHFFIRPAPSESLVREQEALVFVLVALEERSEHLQAMLETTLATSDPFLAGRGVLYGAQLGITECFQHTCAQLSSNNIVRRLCAVKAIAKYADTQAELVRKQHVEILQAMITKTELLPVCSLLLVAESISPVLQIEPAVVLTQQSPLPGLFNILAGNPGDISLVSTVVDIFENLASSVDFAALCNSVLPVLFQTINNTPALRSIAFDILNGIIEGSSDTLPQDFVSTIWPVFSIQMEVEEQQTAHEILRNLVRKAWRQIEECGFTNDLLTIIAVAFQGDESASFYVPQLVTSMIRQAGDKLAAIMPKLLEIIVNKLRTSGLSTAYQQNLISVFAEIAITQAQPLIEFLVAAEGLPIVMSTWCEVFPDFHGYASIRSSVVGLSQIYATEHPALSALEVRGDLIPDTSGRIQTRSRAKTNPDQYTTATVPTKVIKLFLAELVNEMEGKNDDEEVVSDDEWDSTDLSKVIEEAQLNEQDLGRLGDEEDDTLKDINTRQYILEFLKKHFGSGQGAGVMQALAPGEQDTLRGALEASLSS